MSLFEKRFALILAIFWQAGDRVKGGVLRRRSEPLTRCPACRINRDQGEALSRCSICGGEISRAAVAECAMRPQPVVMLAPSSQTIPCFAQRAEPLDIQTFVSQAPVEAFDESVLHRSARPYETKLHTVPDRPDLESAAGKLASVIQGDAFRCCAAF